MAITTTNAHVNVALYLKNKVESTYIGIGRTSEWENDSTPPQPTRDETSLDETIGYKKVDTASLCRKLSRGEETNYSTVTYQGEEWALVPDEQAYEEQATHVYFEGTIEGNELPLGLYRQVGIFTGLEPNEGETNEALTPDKVMNQGLLEAIENRPPYNRVEQTRIVERFIFSTNT